MTKRKTIKKSPAVSDMTKKEALAAYDEAIANANRVHKATLKYAEAMLKASMNSLQARIDRDEEVGVENQAEYRELHQRYQRSYNAQRGAAKNKLRNSRKEAHWRLHETLEATKG